LRWQWRSLLASATGVHAVSIATVMGTHAITQTAGTGNEQTFTDNGNSDVSDINRTETLVTTLASLFTVNLTLNTTAAATEHLSVPQHQKDHQLA